MRFQPHSSSRPARGGFSLIEVLIVAVLILGVLAIAMPAGMSWRREAEFRSACDRVESAFSECRNLTLRDGNPRRLFAEPQAEGMMLIARVVDPESDSLTQDLREPTPDDRPAPRDADPDTENTLVGGRMLLQFPAGISIQSHHPAKDGVALSTEAVGDTPNPLRPRATTVPVLLALFLPDGSASAPSATRFMVQRHGTNAIAACEIVVNTWTSEATCRSAPLVSPKEAGDAGSRAQEEMTP